jgi:hypothetical protein
MTNKRPADDERSSAGRDAGPGGQGAPRGLDRRTVLRAGVLAGGASVSLAAAGGPAVAAPRPLTPGPSEAASAVLTASGQAHQPTVAAYVVERLAALGIEHVFGVPATMRSRSTTLSRLATASPGSVIPTS